MHRAELAPRFKKQILSRLANSYTQKADIKHIHPNMQIQRINRYGIFFMFIFHLEIKAGAQHRHNTAESMSLR